MALSGRLVLRKILVFLQFIFVVAASKLSMWFDQEGSMWRIFRRKIKYKAKVTSAAPSSEYTP